MKKVIRLTESDLTRIVRRVINEAQTEQQVMSMIEDSNCWNSREYPTLWKFTKGSSQSVAGIVMMALSIFGFATGPVAAVGGVLGFTNTVKGVHGIQDLDYDKVAQELIKFCHLCLGIIDDPNSDNVRNNKAKLVNKLKSQG